MRGRGAVIRQKYVRRSASLHPSVLNARGGHYPCGAMALTPQQRRQQEKREEKLKDIREQVEAGTLVIRKMTAKESKLNPPRPRRTTGRKR